MGFVKNIKDKINEHFVANDYDDYESAISDDDYEGGDDEELQGSIYDSEPEEAPLEEYSYSPKSGMNAPEYSFGAKTSFERSFFFEFSTASTRFCDDLSLKPSRVIKSSFLRV